MLEIDSYRLYIRLEADNFRIEPPNTQLAGENRNITDSNIFAEMGKLFPEDLSLEVGINSGRKGEVDGTNPSKLRDSQELVEGASKDLQIGSEAGESGRNMRWQPKLVEGASDRDIFFR